MGTLRLARTYEPGEPVRRGVVQHDELVLQAQYEVTLLEPSNSSCSLCEGRLIALCNTLPEVDMSVSCSPCSNTTTLVTSIG